MSKLKKIEYKNNDNVNEAIFDEMSEYNKHITDKSTSISVIKIGKDKFISVFNKKLDPDVKKFKSVKKENKCYDLNDYDYDCTDF